jgi:hypothetical protein
MPDAQASRGHRASMLSIAYDDLKADDNGARARPNGGTTPGRFSGGWLLRLALLMPDRLRLERTADVLASERPFVYPLELTRAGISSFGADAPGLDDGVPPAVLARVRAGRAVILIWLGHIAAPLEIDASGTRWLFDVVEQLITAHALPHDSVWLVTGTVAAFDDFGEWLKLRKLYPPEVARIHALSVFPTFAQATFRANASGWDVDWRPDGPDGAAWARKVACSADDFRARYPNAAGAAADHAVEGLRERRFVWLDAGLDLHCQIVVSFLQASGHLDDSVVEFGAAPVELNDRCAFVLPGAADVQDRLRAAWMALQPKLPLQVDRPSARARACVEIAAAETFDGYAVVDDRLLAPIMGRLPFVFAGPPDSLRYLHALGFKTFAGVIDEAYDRPNSFAFRMQALLSQIDVLGRCPFAALRDLAVACRAVLEHNQDHLIEGRHQLDLLLRQLERRLGSV